MARSIVDTTIKPPRILHKPLPGVAGICPLVLLNILTLPVNVLTEWSHPVTDKVGVMQQHGGLT
jgi:hypothetical protein